MSSNNPGLIRQILSVTLLVSVFAQQSVQAASPTLPSGGKFVAGSGNIASTNNAVTINQNGARGVIDWTNFSIGQNNLVQFLNGSGATMNRVTGSQMSSILGSLTATGTVYLINPQGIVVGPKGRINTGGDFLASTLNLPNAAFMAGGSLILSGNSASFIKNLGAISSSGGSVFLFANNIANSGSVKAPNGTAGLATGQQILLSDSTSDQRIFVKAAGGDLATTGKIEAAQAELRSNGGNIYALAGNANGLIAATGTATKEGRVWLIAENGKATVDQTITSGNADGLAGNIETSGHSVVTGANAKITTGRGGNWLLDPADLLINSALATTIVGQLGSGNVTETTAGSGGSGDITVASNIAWSSANTLTLSAYRNIGVNTGVTISNTGAGTLNLIADTNATGTGTVSFTGTGKANWSGSTGNVNIYYNPTGSGSTKYNSPTSFSGGVTTNGAVTNQLTAFMLVNTASDLGYIGNNAAGNYALGTNIDASSITNFAPVGVGGNFTGSFDGLNHIIDGLTINDSSHSDVGMFSTIQANRFVQNLGLTNLSVTGAGARVGGIAGTNSGTIRQSFVQGNVTGGSSSYTGGLVATNSGSVTNTYANMAVLGGASANTGGLAGNNAGSITSSYSNGPVTAGAGLVGSSTGGTVTNSYWDTVESGQAASSGGGTAQTTTQLTGSLPTGFSSSIWGVASNSNYNGNSYPYLNWLYPGGATVSVVSGNAWSDHAGTPLVGASVNSALAGVRYGTFTSGADGFYLLTLPLTAWQANNNLVAYLTGANRGNTYVDPSLNNGLGDIYKNYLYLYRARGLAGPATALQSAAGSLPTAYFLYNIGSGITTVQPTSNLELDEFVSGSHSYVTIDQALTVPGTLYIGGSSSSGAAVQTSPITANTLVVSSGPSGGTNFLNQSNSFNTVAGYRVGLYNSGPITIGTAAGSAGISLSSIQATGNITVNTASSNVTLATGGNFINNAGSTGLTGFQVWSQSPLLDTRGGLSYNFKQYNATYGSTTVQAGPNVSGFLYTLAPFLTATLTGSVNKQYDSTSAATLSSSNFVMSGMIDGDTATATGTGSYADKNVNNVGSPKLVNVTGVLALGANAQAAVYGYQVNNPLPSGNIGNITPAPLTAQVNAPATKVYDGTTASTATVDLSGTYAGDIVNIGGSYTAPVYDSKDVNSGNPHAVTSTGTPTISGTDAHNYTLTPGIQPGSGTITPLTLSATINGVDKTYDGTPDATGSTLSALTGVISGDQVSVSGTPVLQFNSTQAGPGNGITYQFGLTLSGADSGNYSVVGVGGTTNNVINPAPVTAQLTVTNKVYNGNTQASATLSNISGIVAADQPYITVDASTASYAFANKNVGNGKTVTPSNIVFADTDPINNPGSSTYYLPDYVLNIQGTGNITPAPLTAALSANNKVYNATTAAAGTIGSINGVIGGDNITGATATFNFNDKNFGNSKSVIASNIALSGTDASNYALSISNGTANITKASATLTVTGANKIYDRQLTDPGASSALTGILGSDNAIMTGSASYSFSDKLAANGKAVSVGGLSLTGGDAANYNLSTVNGTANISQKPITAVVTANNKTYDQGTSASASVGSFNGTISGDSVTVGGSPVWSFASPHAGNNITVTETGLTLSGADAANYSLAGVTGTANINPVTLNATTSASSKTYNGNTSATGSMTLGSGTLNGDTVNVVGDTYNFSGIHAGNGLTVTESGATLSNSDYALGTVATTTANITPKTLTGAISANNKTYNQLTAATGSMTLTGIVNGDPVSVTGDTYSFGSANAGSHTVTETGASLANNSFNDYALGSVGTTTASINPLALTATTTAASKTYNQSTATTGTTTLVGVLTGDTVNVSNDTYAFNTIHAGNGLTVTESGATLSNNNYSLAAGAVATTTANINPIVENATISASSKTYNGNTNASGSLTLSSTPLSGDVVNHSGDTYHFAGSNAGNGITVTESGASLSNSDYTLGTVATTTANITQAPLTATITASNKVYNTNTTDTGTITLNGLLGSDTSTVSGATYNFSTPHVGNGLTVTESGATLGNSNYTLGSVATTTANITPAPLTAALNATNRVYNATTVASGTIGALNGVLTGDTISVNSMGSLAFANKNVGNSITVTNTGATLQGTNPGDYSLAVSNGSANITAAPLTASFSANNKVYDGTPAATGSVSALTGVLSGDTVTFSPGAFTFADKNVGNGKTVTVGGSPLAGTDAGNYTLSVNNSSANITAAPLTGNITANNKIYDATTTATGGLNLNGVIANDNVSFAGANYSFATKNVGTGKTVTEIGGTLAGTDANNYSLGNIANGTASIAQAQLTAALAANGKVYDGNTVATATIGALTGVLGSDVVNVGGQGSFGFSDKNVGSSKTVTASGATLQGADAANYNLSVVNGAATITPASLTGTTTAGNKVYNGNTIAAGSLSLNGVISGDTVSTTGGSYAFADKNVGTSKTVSESGATLTGTSAGNYTLGNVASATANITPAQLTAALTASNKVYNGNVTATGTIGSLTGVVSGDSVSVGNPGSFTFANKNVANNKTVTASGTTLQGNDGSNYSLNVSNGVANITPAQLSGVVAANGKVYDATTAATGTLTLNGAIAGDQVTAGSTGFSFADKNVGIGKSVSASGVTIAGTDAPNYSLGAVTNGTATITPATLTGTTTAGDKVYNGNTNATGSLTLNGVISGDYVSITGATYTFANKNVGNGIAITESGATLAGINGGNYTLGNVAGTNANITPAILTGAVTGANKTYDGTVADAASLTLNGVVGNDQVTAAATYVFNNKNAGTGKAVTAGNATLSGTDAGNYTVGAISSGTANITPATLTASVNGANKNYDGTLTDNGTLTLSGVVGSDQVTGSAAYAFNNKNAGIGKTVTASNTSISGSDAANYTVGSVVNGTADITPATLTASVVGANKTYDATTSDNATLTLAGVIVGDQVSGAATYAFNDKNVGTAKTVTAGNTALSGIDAANYTVGSVANGTATITPATLTAAVAANNKVYDTTTVATGTVGVPTGVLGQDTVSIGASGTLQFADKNVGIGKSVNAVGKTLIGADAGNYTLTVTPGSANITPAQLTASITASDKTYDATNAASGTVTLHGVLGQDTVTAAGTTYAFNTPNAGTGIPVTATGTTLAGADHGNYNLASIGTATAAIDPATLTYTFTGSTVPSGSTLPALTGTVTGLVGGQTLASATTGAPAFTTTATSSSAPGQYPVVGSGLQTVNGNYVFVQAPSNALGLVITTPVNTGTGTGSTGTGSGSTGTGSGSTGTGSGSTGTGSGSTGTGSGSTGTGSGSTGTGSGSTGTGSGSTGTGSGSTGTGSGSTGTGSGSTGTGSGSTGTGSGSTGTGSGSTGTGSGSTGTGSGSTGTGSGSTGTGSGSTGTGSGSTGTGSGSTGTGSGSTGTGSGSSTTGSSLGSNGTGSGSTGSVNGSTYVANNFTSTATLQTGTPIATVQATATGPANGTSAVGSTNASTAATPLSLVVNVIRYTDGSAPNFGLSFAGAPVTGVDLGSISSQLALALIQVPSSTGGASTYQIVAKGTVANYALTLQTGTVTTIDNTARSLPTQSSAQAPVSASTNTNVAAAASVSVKTASVIVPSNTVASGNAISGNTVGNFGVNYSTNWSRALTQNPSSSGSMAQSSSMSSAGAASAPAAGPVAIQSGPSGQAGPAAVQSAPAATQSTPATLTAAPAASDSPAVPSAQPVTPASDPSAPANQTTPAAPADSDPAVKNSAPGNTTSNQSTPNSGKAAKKQKKNEGRNQ